MAESIFRTIIKYRKLPADAITHDVQITGIIANGTEDQVYSDAFEASDGTPPYTWSITTGSLPTGLTLTASTGAVTGTPTDAGSFQYTIRVQDTPGNSAALLTTTTIAPATLALAITTPDLLDPEQNVAYSRTLAAEGGTLPYTWSLASGSLPIGLSLSTGGIISGIPTTLQTAVTFTVRVTDAAAAQATKQFVVDVVTAVDKYAYFESFRTHPDIHTTGFTTITSDGTPGQMFYKFAGGNASVQTTQSVQNSNKVPSYSYTGTDTPDNTKLTLVAGTAGIAAGTGAEFPMFGDVPGTGNIVLVWDEYFPSSIITAQEAVPGDPATANIDKYKWRQIGFQYTSTGRMYEMRTRFDRRNLASEAESSPNRRTTRWDLRVYDDQKVTVGGALPQYVTDVVSFSPTGQYGEAVGNVPSYENKWSRHVVQIRQRLRGSVFTSWSTSAGGGDSNGIDDITRSISALTSSGTTATATLVGHGWQTGYLINIRGANQSEYNRDNVAITVTSADQFTYPLLSDPVVDVATGTITAGTDFDEFSWWIGNESDGWHCVYYKIPWIHQPNGVREWWAEHDTSTNVPISVVANLTRSGTVATGYTGTGAVSITSITRVGQVATVTTSAAHGLSSTAQHRYVLIFGANQTEYNGGFDATYLTATTFSVTVTGSPATPATGTMTFYKSVGHLMDQYQSVRIVGATGGTTAFNGDWIITGTSRSVADGNVDIFTYTVSGSPSSPATGSVTCQRPLLNNVNVFVRGLFALEDYDSPQAVLAGDGIVDPVSSPASYDTALFVLPKS